MVLEHKDHLSLKGHFRVQQLTMIWRMTLLSANQSTMFRSACMQFEQETYLRELTAGNTYSIL